MTEVAGRILQTAHDTVTKQRHDQHGNAENSFGMIAALWGAYLSHNNGTITPADVAHMMTLLKIARSIYGDATHADHYVDAAGYAALAGMLARVKLEPEPKRPSVLFTGMPNPPL